MTKNSEVRFGRVQVGEVNVFYREAGDAGRPSVLLLHGFPSSSHMFRDLIPQLARDFHVIAPDLSGFGFTEAPARGDYVYSFENLAKTIEGFVDTIGLARYAIYVFDYGAPVGFRLARARPHQISGIISQNGNAYAEGLSSAWEPIRQYWSQPSRENRDALRSLLSYEGTRWQYEHGVADPLEIAPEAYTLDHALLSRPGNDEIQLDLFGDYASNVALYPEFQLYFRQYKPPFLAVWGKNDPFFLPAGAEAFRRDMPGADIHLLDTGHFALETHAREIGDSIKKFLTGSVIN